MTLTLDQLHARCDEFGDCLLWTGSASQAGVPKINIYISQTERNVMSARRVVWKLAKGAIPAGRLITTSCGNPRCLNPDHLKLTSHAQVSAKNGARRDVKLKRGASQARFNVEHRAKLTLDEVASIRASEDRTRALASQFGVSVSQVNRIRKGLAWKDYSNPFAGLGA